ncbi:MAG: glycerol-3-phosphate acyltransferase [Gemmatimonadetes bacterium]|nr:glycerol-3-phosphate acyltransferase [Gemmatimonadota bacterium]
MSWLRRTALRTLRRFQVRLDRFKLVDRRIIREQLVEDTVVREAMAAHRRDSGLTEAQAAQRVRDYVDEILPFFSVLSYYRFGYNLARLVLRVLYRVSSEYQDRDALNAIPRKDVVVYLMNHRSNADYVVVAYVLAKGVSLSYAVGEWARTWPLEYVFKSFGAYFIRRKFREPLYHVVLERYVQLITRNGVTQGVFLEGWLSRTGGLAAPKIGLLDYVARTLLQPEFTSDIWLVPVAINYDRVLEDRVLIREVLEPGARRPGRVRQALTAGRYLVQNLGRLMIGAHRRHGRVAVNFGTPLSLRAWMRANPGALDLPKPRRLARLQELADEVMDRIAAIVPVTPVPLTAAALLSFGEPIVRRDRLLERMDEYRDYLVQANAKLIHSERGVYAILDRAVRLLRVRHLVVVDADQFVILPTRRALLEYYANSVRHLLPPAHPVPDRELLRARILEV